MITSRHLAPLFLLALPLLGACQRHETTPSAAAPAAATTGTATTSTAPQTVLGKTVDSALRKAREEMETGNIDISRGVDIQTGPGGHHIAIGAGHGDGKAEITPAGDLLLEGKPADISPAQRALLLQYRQQIIAVAEAGMAVGVKGADLAGKALSETFSGLMHGNADEAGKRIEAEGRKLEADARQICAQLPGMLQSQQQLAASLPAFKPYATMTQHDIEDCGKHGASVTSR